MQFLKQSPARQSLIIIGFALLLFFSKSLLDLSCAAELMDLSIAENTVKDPVKTGKDNTKTGTDTAKTRNDATIAEKKFNVMAAAADTSATYKIGIGDILEIMTWKEPDFSRDNILVRLDGKITFPLLDDIIAVGQTPHQLKQTIAKLLEKYVDSPKVMVSVKLPESQKFYVLGEVLKIGEYPLQKQLTLIQALSMAGGFTQWANKKEILLIRKKPDGGTNVIKIDYKKISQGNDLENNLVLKADDTIIVP